jgi:hypothetical protein
MPGWGLTENWLKNGTISKKGIVTLRYYCGDGEGNYGCRASITYRKALCYMTLIDEGDFIEDLASDEYEGSEVQRKPVVRRPNRRESMSSNAPSAIEEPGSNETKRTTSFMQVEDTPLQGVKKLYDMTSRSSFASKEGNPKGDEKVLSRRVGERYIKANPTQWLEYFCPKL